MSTVALTKPRNLLPSWLTVVALAWAWYVHFWPTFHTANEAIRLYFVQAVVETGRPELDPVVQRHGSVPVDRSVYGGRVYMDKAPGLSLIALPFYPAARAVDPSVAHLGIWKFGIVATWLGVLVPLILALIAMRQWLLALGVGERHVAWTVLALALASPLTVYATLFFGHGLATACVLAAVALVGAVAPQELSRGRGWCAGLLLGYAGLTDTPVFVLAAALALWTALRARPAMLGTWPVFAGIAVFAATQLAYNTWTLGHPLRFTYQYKGDVQLAGIMATGFLGFRPPQLDALVGLLFSAKRGLLYHAPWLALAVVGWIAAARSADRPAWMRFDAAVLPATALGYTLLVSGFADWPAGDSAGPRHLLPVVPLVAAGLGFVLQARLPWPDLARAGLAAMVAFGLLMVVPVVASFPYHFNTLGSPVLDLSWPLVLLGFFAPSLGHFAGLHDVHSFAIYTALVASPFAIAWRIPQSDGLAPRWPRWSVVGLAVALLLLWTAGAMSGASEPGRAVQAARWKAITLLGPATDERAGVAEWQLRIRGHR